jgi:hypothetical protein
MMLTHFAIGGKLYDCPSHAPPGHRHEPVDTERPDVDERQSIIVSKSQEMVDLTMALFAKFWVNGHQAELLALLC